MRDLIVARIAPFHASPPAHRRASSTGSAVPGYPTRTLTVPIGGHPYRLRVLGDNQQFADPDGHGHRMGISSAQWSLFGQLWPSGRLLARAMHEADVAGKRILEIGCGIGLASLVLQRRGATVVASDIHPLAEPFLAYNCALNALPSVHFRQLHWDRPLPSLGDFDMIIASDVLYERGHAELLAGVIGRHARADMEVMVADPGRGHTSAFTRALAAQGFGLTEHRHDDLQDDSGNPVRGRILHYRRALERAA